MKKLKVEYINIEDLKEYENNAKIHTEKQIEQIENSIKKFGMNDPIGIWKDNIIIEGHGRLIACKNLGITEVPVIRLDHLSDEERKAYTLAHNKLTMNTDFDIDLLNSELEELASFDFNMEDFGFENGFDYNEDDFDTDFELPDGDKSPLEQITFTLHKEQAEFIREAIKNVKGVTDDYLGNTNKNGNAIWEVVRQWDELKK